MGLSARDAAALFERTGTRAPDVPALDPFAAAIADAPAAEARARAKLLAMRQDPESQAADAANAAKGRRRQAAGARVEELIVAVNDVYARTGVRARARKRPTPFRVVGKTPAGQLIVVSLPGAGCDLDLHCPELGCGGIAEAKSCEDASPRLDLVTPEQAAELRDHYAIGDVAVVVLRVRGIWRLCPWREWGPEQEGGASLGVKRMEAVSVVCPDLKVVGGLGPDWVEGLRALRERNGTT